MLGSWAAVLGQLIPLALVVAMSPLTIIPAIVLVLQSDRARPAGLAFMFGWLVGLAATTAVFVQLPRLLDGINRPAPTWAAWVRIAVGIALLALALWRWLTRHQVTKNLFQYRSVDLALQAQNTWQVVGVRPWVHLLDKPQPLLRVR